MPVPADATDAAARVARIVEDANLVVLNHDTIIARVDLGGVLRLDRFGGNSKGGQQRHQLTAREVMDSGVTAISLITFDGTTENTVR